jgi:hypothetical protein
MSPHSNPSFPHRINPDKTYDSICAVCYLTIASATIESELAKYERLHACSPIRLYQLSNHLPVFRGLRAR